MAAPYAQLDTLIQPAVEALGYEFVGLQYHAQGKHPVLRVFIDADQGITVDDCAKVSRQVSAVLDVEDPIKTEYNLEISSPGVKRPLFTLQHYQQFIGHEVKVHLTHALNNRRKWQGTLHSVDGDSIVLTVEGEAVAIPYAQIEKGNLEPELSF